MARQQSFRLCAAALIAAALLLRLPHLATPELWVDEAASYRVATMQHWLSSAFGSNKPPLYPLLLRGWVTLFGDSTVALRLLSVLLGGATVAAAIWAGGEIFSPVAGLWAGAGVALAPLAIYYSREVRQYPLLLAALMLAHGAVWRAVRTGRRRDWALFGLATAAVLSTHLLGALGLLPMVVVPLLWPSGKRLRPFFVAATLATLTLAPWFLYLLRHPRLADTASWITTMPQPSWPIARSLELFALGNRAGLIPFHLKASAVPFPAPLSGLGLATAALLFVWLAVPAGDAPLQVPLLARKKLALAVSLALPLTLLWTLSLFRPIYVAGRYDLVAYPAFALLLGLAFAKLQAQPRAGALLAAVAALLLALPIAVKLQRYYGADDDTGFARTARALVETVRDGDVVVFTDLRGMPVLYQLAQLGYRWEDGVCARSMPQHRFACHMFPRETEETPASYYPERIERDPTAVREDVATFLAPLRRGGTIHIVLGKFARSHDQLAATRTDDLLLAALRRRGFTPVAGDIDLGIIRLGKRDEHSDQ
jgi:mannosyltransferase